MAVEKTQTHPKNFFSSMKTPYGQGNGSDGNNPDAKNHLADVRRAVLEQQDYHLADQICQKMQGLFAEAYQPLGNLRIDFSRSGQVTGYRR